MPCVYILYSPSYDKFYIGATTIAAESRLERHLEKFYENKFTGSISDWQLFFEIGCDTMKQALQIEKHIKKMKSKKYLADLKKFPEIEEKLKGRYAGL
jgi:putative endonuclease